MIKRILSILAVPVLCFSQGATNDYIFYQKPETGALVPRAVTPTAGRLMGWPSSINTPAAITLGTGLSLSGSTLNATGGTPAWADITGIPANVTAFGSLANAAGLLTNNGSGTLSYTATTTGGNGAADSGKIPAFGVDGSLQFRLLRVMAASALTQTRLDPTTLNFQDGLTNLAVQSAGTNGTCILKPGTMISTSDTGTVTDTMLAGSISPSKVTGTAAILGANTFTALQTATAFNITTSSNSVDYRLLHSNTGVGSSAGNLGLYYQGYPTIVISGTFARVQGSTRPELQFYGGAWFSGTITAPAGQIGTMELRQTTSPMAWRVSNTWTSDTNWEAGVMDFKTTSNTLRIGSDKGSGGGSNRAVQIIVGGTPELEFSSDGTRISALNTFLELDEVTAPAAPAANKGRLYLEDNGSGKTRLMIQFPSGAAQQIAIEP